MGRRARKITQNTVMGAGGVKQGMLFEDAFTELQEDVLGKADGTRSVSSIAAQLEKPRGKILSIIRKLYTDGYLKIMEPEEVFAVCDSVMLQGRLEDCIGLYRYILDSQVDNLAVMASLAELYVRTARSREAAELYSRLAHHYIESSHLGDALLVLRKAAGLQAGNYQIQNDLAELCLKTGRNAEAARIWRDYALRLAGVGEYENALRIIDNAVDAVGGNDTLFYAEAEVLALMEGKVRSAGIPVPQSDVLESSELDSADISEEDAGSEVDSVEAQEGESLAGNGANDASETLSFGAEPEGENSDTSTAESDRVYANIRYGEYDAAQNESSGGSGLRRNILAALFGLIIILLVLAGINYYYRSRMYSAVLESKGIGSLAQNAGLVQKVQIGDDALAVLVRNKPPFGFMQSSEYSNQLARIEQLVHDTNEELMENNVRFDKFMREWELHHNDYLAEELQKFAESTSIGVARVNQAKKLYTLWLEEKDQRIREVTDFIAVLANRELEPKLRFSAYRKLLVDYPYVFERKYPDGVVGLTVPSRINARIAGSEKSVELVLKGAEKRSDGYWEIPVTPGNNIIIEHFGYTLGEDMVNTGRTKMPYPLTFEQFFVLKKVPVTDIRIALGFMPEVAEIVENSEKFVLSDRREYMVVDLFRGIVSARGEYSRREDDTVNSAGLEIFSLSDWVGILNDGVVYTGNLGSESDFEFNALKGAGENLNFAAMSEVELGNYDGVGVIAASTISGPDGAGSPVEIFEAESGKRVWKNSAALKGLADLVTAPVVYAGRVLWYYILVCSDGSVLVVMENGDILESFDLDTLGREGLRSADVGVFETDSGCYLFAAGRVFRIDLNAEPKLIRLWELAENNGRVTPSSSGIILNNSEGLTLYNLSNGEVKFRYQYSGELLLEPVNLAGVVYAVIGNSDFSGAELIALDTENKKDPLLWSYELDGRVSLMCAGVDRVYLLGSDGRIRGFER